MGFKSLLAALCFVSDTIGLGFNLFLATHFVLGGGNLSVGFKGQVATHLILQHPQPKSFGSNPSHHALANNDELLP